LRVLLVGALLILVLPLLILNWPLLILNWPLILILILALLLLILPLLLALLPGSLALIQRRTRRRGLALTIAALAERSGGRQRENQDRSGERRRTPSLRVGSPVHESFSRQQAEM
jgi:endonuclease/exonuclease/phosphatase (EEP) superfamily protein YafD